jgi:hypothetical protein
LGFFGLNAVSILNICSPPLPPSSLPLPPICLLEILPSRFPPPPVPPHLLEQLKSARVRNEKLGPLFPRHSLKFLPHTIHCRRRRRSRPPHPIRLRRKVLRDHALGVRAAFRETLGERGFPAAPVDARGRGGARALPALALAWRWAWRWARGDLSLSLALRRRAWGRRRGRRRVARAITPAIREVPLEARGGTRRAVLGSIRRPVLRRRTVT